MWFLKALFKSFPQRFTFAKLTHIPGISRLIEYMAFEDDKIYYLARDSSINNSEKKDYRPKIKKIKLNKSIQKEDIVLPSDIVKYYIQESNYHWIMNFCICRHSSNCEKYSINLGCLFLGEAAQDIDPKIGRKVTKQEAIDHVKRCSEEGLVHLIGRNKIDIVWLDLHPGNKLMTICNCCECCCLWRMIPNVSKLIQNKITKLSGVKVEVNDNCIGCESCSDVCFVNAIEYINNKAVISTMCRGCGRCVEHCPNDAIQLTLTDEEVVIKTISSLDELVDVK
ncbi:MAG: indolepyruvate ferredoxin oxidoreductase subunit alpha [Candidatus Hodarchaeales archaeon]|jgi:ferredoxin